MKDFAISFLFKLLFLTIIPLFLFFALPSFTNTTHALAACVEADCIAAHSQTHQQEYYCEGTGTDGHCEDHTWSCNHLNNPGVCTLGAHNPAPGQCTGETAATECQRWRCDTSTSSCVRSDGTGTYKVATCNNACTSPANACLAAGDQCKAACNTAAGETQVSLTGCTGTTPICCQPASNPNPPPTQATPTPSGGCPTQSCGSDPTTGFTCGWDPINQMCDYARDSGAIVKCGPGSLTMTPCKTNELCYYGCGCRTPQAAAYDTCVHPYASYAVNQRLPCGADGNCPTAIGNITASAQGLVTGIFKILLLLGGTIALILIIISGYRLMTSRGNPEHVQGAREQLTAAIVGLLFIIFSFVILQFIGVDILGIFH